MADENASTEEASITIKIRASNETRYSLTLPESTTVLELKNKLSTAEYADTPPERQRLIYSGKILKDDDTLASWKIKDGHTIHLVKSVAGSQRQTTSSPATSAAPAPATGTPPSIPGVPTNFAAGTGNNPLAGLTGARYAGYAQLPGAGMFGPDGGVCRSLHFPSCYYWTSTLSI
jgi:ubiquilin